MCTEEIKRVDEKVLKLPSTLAYTGEHFVLGRL